MSDVWRVVERLAAKGIERGARAVVLAGSHARGDAHAESDVDLYFIGTGSEYELARVDGLLVSSSWATEQEHRESLLDPARAGAAVPGWRGARVVVDPHGAAAQLQREAREWSWEAIGDAALDAWVVENVTGYAEEVHKLVVALERGRELAAAAQRSVLALRMARVMSVRLRLLYDSENVLWDVVSAGMGPEWAEAQRRALGSDGDAFDATCAAALQLWALAADAVIEGADERQRAVIEHARGLAGVCLSGRGMRDAGRERHAG